VFLRLIALGVLLALVGGCKSHSPSYGSSVASQYSGVQWIAWDDARRDAFVLAYTDGYITGTHDACLPTDQSLDLKKGFILEHGKDEIVLPSGVCRANAGNYSGCKENASEGQVCSAYTQVITAFYVKHAEYRNIPFEYLMRYLTDKEHKSADELYSMAKSGAMKTEW
jgi:hypothetical protein